MTPAPTEPPSIAISIPAFNEEGTIESVVRESLETLRRRTDDYEVIVIDDGSRDRTGAIADRLAGEDPRVRVIHHPTNLGFGRTLSEMLLAPVKEWVFFIPGDGQIPARELDKLWPLRDRADFILGWRRERADPWRRRLTAFIYNILISALLGRRVHDVDSVVLFRRRLADRFTLTARSVFLHAEFCLRAAAAGAVIAEAPIAHLPRVSGQALGNRPGVIWATFREMLAYAARRGLSGRP